MADLNGKVVDFKGLSFAQIGERILDGSPSGDGKGIILILTLEEQMVFERVGGLMVGYSIVDLVTDAIKKRTNRRPENLRYSYHDMKFTT